MYDLLLMRIESQAALVKREATPVE